MSRSLDGDLKGCQQSSLLTVMCIYTAYNCEHMYCACRDHMPTTTRRPRRFENAKGDEGASDAGSVQRGSVNTSCCEGAPAGMQTVFEDNKMCARQRWTQNISNPVARCGAEEEALQSNNDKNGEYKRMAKACDLEWIFVGHRESLSRRKRSRAGCFCGHRAYTERRNSRSIMEYTGEERLRNCSGGCASYSRCGE